MSRFAFVTWDGGGNVPPAVGIAQELTARGHAVRFIGYEVQRKRFETQGFSFTALARTGQFDIYRADEPARRIAGLMDNVWAGVDHLADIPEAVAADSTDVLVVDFMMQGALAATAQLTVPVAVLAHSSIAGLIPPPESPMGAARLVAANRVRERAGLKALTRLNEAWIRYPTLVTTITALDPAAKGAEDSVHYVGPVFERFPDRDWNSPWAADDDRPMVLVSFTTTRLWDQGARIRNTLEALDGEPFRVLVSAAQKPDVPSVPINAAIRPFVPHALVLPSTAVTVTHAGHGTVTASLAHGVPLVALPNPVADQPFLAAALQRLGAGIALDGESGPAAIRAAVEQVTGQPSYAGEARMLAELIRQAPGAAGAAVHLERLSNRHSEKAGANSGSAEAPRPSAR
jgi:MGT family glycosyltransferase